MKLDPKLAYPILILLVGILGAAALIATRSDVETETTKPLPPLIRAVVVRFESLELTVLAQGTVAPRTESDLIARVSGRVIEISPKFANGGFFEKGDVLIRIDQRDYVLALAITRAEVARAQVRYSLEREEAEVAKVEWSEVGEGEPSDLVLRKPQLAQASAALGALEKEDEDKDSDEIKPTVDKTEGDDDAADEDEDQKEDGSEKTADSDTEGDEA